MDSQRVAGLFILLSPPLFQLHVMDSWIPARYEVVVKDPGRLFLSTPCNGFRLNH
jgi:hypothetical protein